MDSLSLDARFENLENVTNGISRAKLKVAYSGINKKGFSISEEVFNKAIPSMLGKPVVAHFFKDGELGGHEDDIIVLNGDFKKTGKTYGYGFIDYVNLPYFEIIDGKTWICCTVYIHTERFPESEKILNANHSMEVKLSISEIDSNGVAIVDEMEFLAVCALNNNESVVKPTFEGSSFEKFSIDIQSDLKELKEEVDNYIGKENFAIKKGINEAIKVSTDGKKAIEGNVGEKDINAMKRKIFMAKNYKTIIPKIYAKYPENLNEDFNLSDVGYPLMSERNGVFYYNTGFIKAGSSRIEQNKDQPYYQKVRENIVKARKAVGMKEDFTKEDFVVEKISELFSSIYKEFENKYIPYSLNEEENKVFVINAEDMKKFAISYELKEEEFSINKEVMSVEFGDEEKAIKTVIMLLKEKLIDSKIKELDELMVNYSVTEKELKESKEKLETFSDFQKDENKALKELVSLKASLETKESELENLKVENEKFSTELLDLKLQNKKLDAEKVLAKEEFSILSKEEKEELLTIIENSDIEMFTLKAESKVLKKLMSENILNTKEKNNFSIMSSKVNTIKKENNEEVNIFKKLKQDN